MAKPPKIVIPGLNRGAGIPGGYILGRSPRSKQGPAQLLNLIEVVRMGIQTVAGSSQGDADTGSTAASATSSLSSSISTQISSAVSTNVTQSTSLSQISSSLSGAISTNVGQSTSLSQISSSLSGAISSTSSLSTAVSTVISGSISTVNSRIDSLSAAGGGGGVAVQDEGVPVTTATTLNFTGAGVSATNAGGGVVQVDIPAGAAASSTSLSQISSSLSSEISSRISGDSSLSTVISSEVSSRASGDTSLSTVISGSISAANSRIDSLSTAVGSSGERTIISTINADGVTTTFTFNSISGSYKRLEVECWFTTSSGATFTIKCNNDASALYQMQRTGHENGAINLQQLTQTSWNPTNATFSSGIAVDFKLSFGNYASANKKLARMQLAAGTTGSGALAIVAIALLYDSTTAVSRLDFTWSAAPPDGYIRLVGIS